MSTSAQWGMLTVGIHKQCRNAPVRFGRRMNYNPSSVPGVAVFGNRAEALSSHFRTETVRLTGYGIVFCGSVAQMSR
jgi:hypothetical protein